MRVSEGKCYIVLLFVQSSQMISPQILVAVDPGIKDHGSYDARVHLVVVEEKRLNPPAMLPALRPAMLPAMPLV